MVPEGYVMHRRVCFSAMARWCDTSASPSEAQRALRRDDSPSSETMYLHDHATGLEMPMASNGIGQTLPSGGRPVTLAAIQKGMVAS